MTVTAPAPSAAAAAAPPAAAGRGASHVTIGSPVGPLTLIAAAGRLTGLHMEVQRHPLDPAAYGAAGDPAAEPFAAAARQLDAYFAGQLQAFDLPLDLAGTPFQQRVWAELQRIPFGETATYGELAAALGKPSASRAVGLANGRNPVSIVVPCHRVIGSDGSLTGYGGGIDRKRFLLALERGGAPAQAELPGLGGWSRLLPPHPG
jgi:methylated-DNA-[protein]-cysteine S-methyltransferase